MIKTNFINESFLGTLQIRGTETNTKIIQFLEEEWDKMEIPKDDGIEHQFGVYGNTFRLRMMQAANHPMKVDDLFLATSVQHWLNLNNLVAANLTLQNLFEMEEEEKVRFMQEVTINLVHIKR